MALKSVLVVVSLLLSVTIGLVLGRGGVAKDSGEAFGELTQEKLLAAAMGGELQKV